MFGRRVALIGLGALMIAMSIILALLCLSTVRRPGIEEAALFGLAKNAPTALAVVAGGMPVTVGAFLIVLFVDFARRRRTVEALQRTERRHGMLVDATSCGILECDCSGTVLYGNRVLHEMLGCAEGDLVGRPVWDPLASVAERQALRRRIETLARNQPTPRSCVARAVTKDQRRIDLSMEWDCDRDRRGRVVGLRAIVTDMTAVPKGQLEQVVLAGLGSRLAGATTVEAIIEIVQEQSRLLLDWDAHFFAVRRPSGDRYSVTSIVDDVEGKRRSVAVEEWTATDFSPPVRTVLGGQAVLINREPGDSEPRLERIGAGERPSVSLMYVPIQSGEDVTGLLSFQSHTQDRYRETDLETVKRIAEAVTPALERVRAEDERRETEVKLQALLDATADPVLLIDPEGGVLISNEAATREFDKSVDEMIGLCVYDVLPSDLIPSRKAHVQKVLQTGEPDFFQDAREGREFDCRVYPVWGDRDEIIALAVYARDMTEERQATRALQESEAKYRQLVDHLPAVTYTAMPDATSTTVFISPQIHEFLGYTQEECAEDPDFWVRRLHPDDRERVLKEVAASHASGVPFVSEYRILRRNGNVRWFRDTASLVRDENGKPLYLQGFMQDITERKRAEDELLKFKTICDRANYGITITDLDGKVLYANEEFASMHGYEVSETVGQHLSIFHTRQQMKDLTRMIEQVLREGSYVAEEVWHTRKSGGQFPTLINLSAIADEQDTASFLLITATDITGRKRMEEALRQSQEKYRDLVENINDIMYTVDEEGVLTYISPAAKPFSGYSPSELIGRRFSEFIHPDDLARIEEEFRHGLAGEVRDGEHRVLTKSGDVRWVRTSDRPTRDEGRVVGLHGLMTDITERKQAEEALQASEEKYRTLVESASETIVTLDRNGRFLFINRIGAQRLNGRPEDFIGRSVWDVFPKELATSRMAHLQAVLESGQGRVVEEEIASGKDPAETARWYRTSLQPVRDASGAIGSVLVLVADITERRLVEEALRESEEKYRTLVESAGETIATVDANGVFLFMNGTAAERLGGKPEDFEGRTMWDLFPEDVANRQMDSIRDVIQSGQGNVFESISRPKGEPRWYRTNVQPLRNDSGEITSALVVAADITERKQAEAALSVSEERYRLVVENASEGILVAQDETVKFVNPKAIEIFRRSSEELFRIPFADLLHPDDRDMVLDRYRRRLASEDAPAVYPFRIVDKDGDVRWLEINVVLITWEGRPAALGFVNDITERKRVEEALREERDRAQTYLDVAKTMFVALGADQQVTLINQKGCEILGYEERDIVGANWFDRFLPERIRDEVKEVYGRLMVGEAETVEYHENPVLTRSGEERLIAWKNTVLTDSTGAIVGALSAGEDITERKQAEEALRESEQRYRSLFENSPVSLWEEDFSPVKEHFDQLRAAGVTDFRTHFETCPDEVVHCAALAKITDVNKATLDLYAATSKEELLAGLDRVFTEESYAAFREELIAIAEGKTTFEAEGATRTLTGDKIEIGIRFSVAPGHEDTLDKALISIVDITTQKEAERTKREFVANMSHEIRTPINGIIGMTQLALESGLSEEQHGYLETIDECSRALQAVIDDVMDYSKIEAGQLDFESVAFDLETAVEGAVAVVAPRAGEKHIDLISRIHPDVPRCLRGDAGRLRQVLINLIGNAVKFTEVGQVVVDVALTERTDATTRLRFSVSDTGIGIPAEKIPIIFESFRQADGSMSRRYGGTGLGLSISKRLVEMMGGQLGLESTPGEGSRFHFELAFGNESPDRPLEIVPPVLRNAHVLVAEANRDQREAAAEMLGVWGCRCLTASTASGAIEVLDQASAQEDLVNLVVVDLRLIEADPDSVDPLIERVAHHGCSVVALVPTAGRIEESLRRSIGWRSHVLKPVRRSRLLAAVAEALGWSVQPADVREKPARTAEARAGRGGRVLLVEDSPVNQRVAAELLARSGYVVVTANNGREALEALEHTAFDAVLMDIQMPELDGLEATRRLRAEARFADLPVIAMTAHALKGDRERCLAAGMSDYISKPVHADQLTAVLERWIRSRPSGERREKLEPSVPSGDSSGLPARAAGPQAPIDLDVAMYHCGGNRDLFDSVAETYLDSASSQLEAARQDIRSGEWDSLARKAHNLRSSSATVGAVAMSELAAELEEAAARADTAQAEALVSSLEVQLQAVRDFITESSG